MASNEAMWRFELALQAEKDRQENNRAYLREVAIYHRVFMTMIFIVAITSGTVFASMIVYYVNAASHVGVRVVPFRVVITICGMIVCVVSFMSQALSIIAYRYVTRNYVRPAFQNLSTLLMGSHVIYFLIWLALLVVRP